MAVRREPFESPENEVDPDSLAKENSTKLEDDSGALNPEDLGESSGKVKNRIDVKVFPYKHALPVHVGVKHSLLAKEAPPQSYRGFLTLAMLILLATNIRLVVENFLKYGVLLSYPTRTVSNKDWVLALLLTCLLQVSCVLSLAIEKMLVHGQPGFPMGSWLHWVNITSSLLIPTYVVYNIMFHPLVGCSVMSGALITCLKLISFVCVNSDLRRAHQTESTDNLRVYTIAYPSNLTLPNFYYFMCAPTLCYQLSYPRTQTIRLGFIIKRLGEAFLANLLTYFLVVQYAIPTLRNSRPLAEGSDEPSTIFLVERVLKLSTISVTVWLLGFYSIFHSFLNALAEVMRFGDRNFYQPWWNSSSLSQYWRLWNQPVHHWMKRHIYVPGVSAGYPGWFMMGITFFFSAVFHELLFGVAVHSFQGYAFWGMLGQIPLIMITSLIVKWRGPTSSAGNVIFWLSFCIIGQPFLVVLYYYDWTRRNPAVVPSPSI